MKPSKLCTFYGSVVENKLLQSKYIVVSRVIFADFLLKFAVKNVIFSISFYTTNLFCLLSQR